MFLYRVKGKVIKGDSRGKLLGYPTANVRLHRQLPEGIYAAEVKLDGKIYQSATFIGSAKTFGKKDIKIECYILDFDGNIYGKWISIKVLKKIRDNKKFLNQEILVSRIKEDVKNIRDYFKFGAMK